MQILALLSQFTKVGKYTLGMVPEPAPDWEVTDASSPDDHSVYLLTHRNKILYAGKSVAGAGKERLSWYGRLLPGRNEHPDTETRNRLRLTCVLLEEHLNHNSPEPVEALLFRPEPVEVFGLRVHIHSGVEDALHPLAEWNQPGRPTLRKQIEAARSERDQLAAQMSRRLC